MVEKHLFEEPHRELKELFGNLMTALGHHLDLILNQMAQMQKHLASENERLLGYF